MLTQLSPLNREDAGVINNKFIALLKEDSLTSVTVNIMMPPFRDFEVGVIAKTLRIKSIMNDGREFEETFTEEDLHKCGFPESWLCVDCFALLVYEMNRLRSSRSNPADTVALNCVFLRRKLELSVRIPNARVVMTLSELV